MEISQTVNLYITYVEKEGPFLKVWGQTEKNNSIYVEQFLAGASPQFDLGIGKISTEQLQAGTLVCAKYKDNKYYRARIINASLLNDGFIEVSFLDYGNRDIVPCGNIRSLQNFPSSFISIPPLATGFIFAEAHCIGGGEWNDNILENIFKDLKYREVLCTIVIQAAQYFLVKLAIGGADLCELLINRGFMQPISLPAQQAVLLSMSLLRTNNPPPSMAIQSANTGINTYKTFTLEPGCQYQVYVSYVNDGPCHFSVQLKQSENALVILMHDINTITLRLLEDVPIPGTICLARCQEDGNICRAVVTNEVDNQFKVFYVDFGNYEVVPLDALFQIPFRYVIPKVMAVRFSLAGVEKSTVTLEMQYAFKQFVDNRLLNMKVLPTPTRTAISKCELWDPETSITALEVVNRAAQNAYPEPVVLSRGFSQPIKVSYVYSCNRFYVQLTSKENELLKVMLDLQASCQMNDSMDPSTIKVGLPCCALFESDQQWYRSQIVEVLGNSVKVRYIDYGNEELIPTTQLKIIDGEQLTVLRPQAIECCLNGYQNMEEDPERDGLLEELILEGKFTMKVVEMTNKKALVELFDDSNYNIASLLLDKLAAAKSQVSPMLVQAGNKIEHRKSFSHQNGNREQNYRQDHKPERSNERNENSWRHEKKDFRGNERNSNENNERNSWRQQNKGFSPNSDKFNNRDKNRNRGDWHNKENVSDGWDTNKSKPQEDDDWGTSTAQNTGYQNTAQNTGYQNVSRDNDFNRSKGNKYDRDNNWNSRGPKGGGFKKKDFRKDSSDISSSGSEKSFQRGPRTSSRNERPQFHKKFDKPKNTFFNNTNDGDDSWNVSDVSPPIDSASATATFAPYDVVGMVSNVIVSWFHSPSHFYCQLSDIQAEFKSMMSEIQLFYKSRKPESAVVGAPIIGLFPEDNVLYRAQVLEVLGSQYKVYYVDFGNVSNISKVWPIDKKFMNLPAQAIVCSLNEIAPPGDQWPDPDQYSKYFDKDVYECRFVNKDEEKTYVEFYHGSDDIKRLLIQNGLALSTQKIIPDIEIPILLGQQFKAILKSINNLSDIIIALECGVALSCEMHNFKDAVTTDENNLKRFLEHTVIVYADNVIDDRLEITLYDTEGSKIDVINPDEGACDMVELPCPILILRSTLSGYVTHATDMSVFIQPTEYADFVVWLLDQMYEAYENLAQDGTIIPEVERLYAVNSSDGNWYRARVTNMSDTQASVQYIDYGNTEDVDFDKLRQLSDKFLEVCFLCVEVFTTVDTNVLLDKEVITTISYGENGWEGVVDIKESSSTESALVDQPEISDDSSKQIVIEHVETAQELNSVLEKPQEIVTEEATSEISVESNTQNGTQVVVSHIDSPTEFYLQLAESLNAIDELQYNLQEQVSEMPVLETPTAGILCAAPFSLDQQWYRAEVLDADDDITTVRFIDYGNTDVISNETTKIKTLPPNLLSLAVYATRSSLRIKPVVGEWSTSATEKFEALVGENSVSAEFVDQDEKTNYVELYVNGQNIKEILINENVAVPIELTEENKSTCFVSHLNSPSEFWLQLENCVDELEWIAEQLSGAELFPELEESTPGTLCAALFPDDQMWYRARILSNTIAGIELLFIDYGNSSISSSLRQLPEDLVVTAPLAQKCSLQKPDGIDYWSPQAAEKFSEISADGQTIFTVHKISTGETSVVQLFVDGNDVTSMLKPETEDCYVKTVESLDSFEIEKNGEVLSERYRLEPLPGMQWVEGSVEQFKEVADQGSKLLQIEFVTQNIVRIYINGEDIRSNLGAIRTPTKKKTYRGSKGDLYSIHDNVGNTEQISIHGSLEDILQVSVIENISSENAEVLDLKSEDLTEEDNILDNDNTEVHTKEVTEKDGELSSIDEHCGSDADKNKNEVDPDVICENSTTLTLTKEESQNSDESLTSDANNDESREILQEDNKNVLNEQNDGSKRILEENINDVLNEQIDENKEILEENSNDVLNEQSVEEKEIFENSNDVLNEQSDENKEILEEKSNNVLNEQTDESKEILVLEEKTKNILHEQNNENPENEHLSQTNILDCSIEAEIESILRETVNDIVSKKECENTSRPVSSCSGKISHDDRIVPAVASRSESPVQAVEKVDSRPSSICSGKIPHDERIIPAVLSRPQTPVEQSDDTENAKTNEEK